MDKRLYYIILIISFGLLSIPMLFSITLKERIVIDFINPNFLKTSLLFFICYTESSYLKNKTARLVVRILTVLFFIGIIIRIMHWPLNGPIVLGSGLGIGILLLISAIRDKNKKLLHYLLFLFIIVRTLIILHINKDLFWWVEGAIYFGIIMVGILSMIKEAKE